VNNILWITGGMSCGKSTLVRSLLEHGREHSIPLRYISIDSLRRALTVQPNVRAALSSSFSLFLDDDVECWEKALRPRIWENRESLAQFEAILEPYVRRATLALLSTITQPTILEWALFFEWGWQSFFPGAICLVTCSRQEQMKRLTGGDLSEREVELRLGRQFEQTILLQEAHRLRHRVQATISTDGNASASEINASLVNWLEAHESA
jgi:dephospho-CoA kinase